RDSDERRQDPVSVLDKRVRFERRCRPPVTLRPIRAAEPRPGQPHPGAGEDDQGQSGQRDRGDLRIAGRRDLQASVQAFAQHPALNLGSDLVPPSLSQRLAQPPLEVDSIRYSTSCSSSSGLMSCSKFCGITFGGYPLAIFALGSTIDSWIIAAVCPGSTS